MMTDNLCTVIGFDPGETTGWCIMSVTPPDLGGMFDGCGLNEAVLINEFKYGQIDCRTPTFEDVQNEIWQHPGSNFGGESRGVCEMLNLFDKHPKAAVIVEDFVLDPRVQGGRNLLSPVRIMSSLSFGMYCQGFESRVFTQDRGDPKRICTDARLKSWGLTVDGGHDMRHARDAARHAYYFLRGAQGDSEKAATLRWRAWPHQFADPAKRTATRRPRPVGERIPGL